MIDLKRKRILIPICVLIWSFICIRPLSKVHADSFSDRTVRVGYYENEVFQEGADEGLVKNGYAYEYYRKLSEYTGWNYEYVYGGYDELYQKLLSGDIDLLAGLAKREDRIGLIGYPDSPMGNEVYTLVKHITDDTISPDIKTIEHKKIGVLKSAIADVLREYLNSHSIDAEIVEFGDYESLFSAFDNHETDILAAEGDGAYGREDAEVVCTFGVSDYYLCVSISRDDLLAELNIAQSELTTEEPNYLSSLRSKYYSSSISSHTFSSDEREWILNHDSLTIGYFENYLPYSSTDKDGNVTGIIKDIIPEMLDEMNIEGIRVSYIGYAKYDDMITAVRSDVIDAAFPVGGGLYYSEESGIYQSNAVASATTDLVYKGEFNENTVKHFAVNENNRMQDYYIRTHFPDAQITMYPSIDDCLKAVLSGKASATTLNGLRANDILRNSKYDGLNMIQSTKNDDRSFGVKIGNDGLLRLLNRGINVLGSEYAQTVSYRYAGDLYEYTFSDMIRDHLWQFFLLGSAAVIFVLWLIFRDLRRQRHISRMKTDFVSNMSHEIRTPITAILGMNELIQRESSDPQVLNYSDNIEKAGETLLGIINDILDFSKIEAGKMEIIEAAYSLPEMILSMCNMIKYRAEEKGLELETAVDGQLPCGLVGDEQKIRQVLANLLSNAVKYTEKGRISLRVAFVSKENDKLVIKVEVEDTGIGIREDEVDKLYSAFERLDIQKTRNIEGSGLGLPITQHILELMGSRVDVKSTYGKGSVFTFELTQGISDATPIGDFAKWENSGSRRNGNRKTASFTAPEARILIVDDTPMNLQVISGLLKRNKMMIDTAGSGEECITLFGEKTYDMVFLDQRMPNMDGIETLQELKKRFPDRFAQTPVLSLTANVLAGAKEEMLKAGFTDYLTKPVNLFDIEQTMLKYLPKEKIKAVETDDGSSISGSLLPEDIYKINELDVTKGLEYCGDEEDYLDALIVFAESAETRAVQLNEHMTSGDFEAFSLLAHSIKSTLGAIGAEKLREKAYELELAGKDKNEALIKEKTPEFTEEYKTLGQKIAKAAATRSQ